MALRNETKVLSERRLRICLGRHLIITGVKASCVSYVLGCTTDHWRSLLPFLLRCSTATEVNRMLYEVRPWWGVQTYLLRALTVVPRNIARRVSFSPVEGGGYIWDAAPLIALLTDDDLEQLLGDLHVIRLWLRRQHQLPEARRPAGLPAKLSSPRDFCDLLLNVPLVTRAISQCAPAGLE